MTDVEAENVETTTTIDTVEVEDQVVETQPAQVAVVKSAPHLPPPTLPPPPIPPSSPSTPPPPIPPSLPEETQDSKIAQPSSTGSQSSTTSVAAVTEGSNKALEEAITCSGCKKRFATEAEGRENPLLPKLLPSCFHTLCLKCIEDLQARDPKVTCPICHNYNGKHVTKGFFFSSSTIDALTSPRELILSSSSSST